MQVYIAGDSAWQFGPWSYCL